MNKHRSSVVGTRKFPHSFVFTIWNYIQQPAAIQEKVIVGALRLCVCVKMAFLSIWIGSFVFTEQPLPREQWHLEMLAYNFKLKLYRSTLSYTCLFLLMSMSIILFECVEFIESISIPLTMEANKSICDVGRNGRVSFKYNSLHGHFF